MTSLSDQVDRLSRNTKAIRSIAVQTASSAKNIRVSSFGVPGPFTFAILNSDLGDLIRDIDPSELGLFTLLIPPRSHPRDDDAHDIQPVEISRAEFPGSTPLRKAPLRRDGTVESKEIGPEIYAQAALKYINRYEPIRSMPRAYSQIMTVLERLAAVRRSIQSLSSILEQVGLSPPQPEEEEKRVQELHLRLKELKRRKIIATSQQKPRKFAVIREKSNIITSPPSPHEDNFWSTPDAPARALRFSDNLMDGNLDLNDITTTSFILPASATPNKDPGHVSSNYSFQRNTTPPSGPDDYLLINNVPATGDDDNSKLEDEVQGNYSVSFDADPSKPASLLPPPSFKHSKVRINNEVERIVEKIWITAGDLILPGHPSEVGGHNVETMTSLKAKEMITHLQLLSESPFIPESPTASSVSSASTDRPPTSQQILTAYLLLTLLTSAPRYSMPLNQVKDLLASKAMRGPIPTQGITRVVYGCVAKRLIKIERGGGEQIVKFDI
ncbi:hypothetical protein BDZ94DRAFT_1275173 [Collybia nuda]|uniref:Uncharacterized protein n=1 Tax=Collybia nuda TaxID=64659 RepID=A0A9P5XS04_9AGAR|nr:hypothetical protein BDZ94DRAFT_1275173 [Collybia nuda]